MLLRSSTLPAGVGFSFEPKWDGFRALVSTAGERLLVRSRRRWDMSDLVPELAGLPAGRVYDGELIAFGADGLPSFPRLCQRMLAGHTEIPVMFVAFDLLADGGKPLLALPYRERRRRLEALALDGRCWCTSVATDDGETLWRWVCERGLEGVVAKRLGDRYWPGERRWLKVKNRAYSRYRLEVEASARSSGTLHRSKVGTKRAWSGRRSARQRDGNSPFASRFDETSRAAARHMTATSMNAIYGFLSLAESTSLR